MYRDDVPGYPTFIILDYQGKKADVHVGEMDYEGFRDFLDPVV
jgi:hypothetical protein